MERAEGIEPSSEVWKTTILTIILRPHIFAMFLMSLSRCQGLLLTAYDLAFDVITSILHIANKIALSYFGAGGRTRTGTDSRPRDFLTTLCHHSRIIALQSGLCLHHIISDLGGWCIVSTHLFFKALFFPLYVSVKAWQFGHKYLKLLISLLELSPSI